MASFLDDPFAASCRRPRKAAKMSPVSPAVEDPPDFNQRYCWVCVQCGDRRGTHYYPARRCGRCGGTCLVRQATRSELGYRYRRPRPEPPAN